MNMPMEVYIGYAAYLAYTVLYVYNRVRGKSAQFFTARVLPTNSDEFKIFADICVGGLFLFSLLMMILKLIGLI